MSIRYGRLLLGLGVLLLAPMTASAQTSANLSVTANVVSSCSVAAGTLAFGAYDPAAAGALEATGSFSVTCTQGTVATLALDNGGQPSGGTRRMTNGTSFLNYLLFKDSGRSQAWGAAGAERLTLAAAPSFAPRTVNVFGRVGSAQDVSFGNYSDTVIITVTF